MSMFLVLYDWSILLMWAQLVCLHVTKDAGHCALKRKVINSGVTRDKYNICVIHMGQAEALDIP